MLQNNNEREEENGNRNNREEGIRWGAWLGYGAAAVATIAGGLYLASTISSGSKPPEAQGPHPQSSAERDERDRTARRSTFDNLQGDKIVPEADIQAGPNITNVNSLLADVYVRYVDIKKKDFDLHFKVSEVVAKVHQNMKTVDKYYGRYANDIRFAGSH